MHRLLLHLTDGERRSRLTRRRALGLSAVAMLGAGAVLGAASGCAPPARFAQVERHLRGLDVAMVEIGYRYTEQAIAVPAYSM